MISSLQDLIAQFKGNFHLSPSATKTAANTSGTGPSRASLSPKDKVTLSTEAQAYQKAHTLPSGKFLPPNMFGDFMDVLDSNNNQNSDQNPDSSSQASGSTLLDYLNQGSSQNNSSLLDLLNKAKSNSNQKSNTTQNLHGSVNSIPDTGLNPINNKPLSSLSDFL